MKKFNKKQRLYLYTFFRDMIESEVPVFDGLTKLQAQGKTMIGRTFTSKINTLILNISSSSSISDALSNMIPQDELAVISSSETSGLLVNGFDAAIDKINFTDEIRKNILNAIISPLIMLSLSFVVIAGYAIKVFPAFETVLPIEKWPVVTSMLYNTGIAIYNGGWMVVILVFVAVYYCSFFLMHNITGTLRQKILDRVIPFTVYKRINSAFFLGQIAMMLKSGIPFANSLGILADNGNRWFKSHMNNMLEKMNMGNDYGDVFNTGLLSKYEVLNIHLYSELPSFDQVLLTVSAKSKVDVMMYIESFSKLLKSMATLFLGGSVIWIFVALFSLSDVLSKMTGY